MGSRARSTPSKVIRPESGARRPESIESVVVLPAPFGPRRP